MSDSLDSVHPQSSSPSHEKPRSGRVYLVGAGPGDPGLLTLRGRECLQMADVVLYDALANDQLLEHAPQAECVSVGKHGKLPIWTQQAINERLVKLAQQGKTVVRLKGGDPAVFARTAEELEVLEAARIPFEVVPGITAALAAASFVGIPITHRHHASAVAFITGQQQAGGVPQQMDWDALARFPGTIVFYMGVTTVGRWTEQLMAAGKSAETPAAIVRRCTWSDQSVVRCQLGDLVQHLTPASKMRPPVIVIVGSVANLGQDWDWFSQRPLHGCGVMVTRPVGQSDNLLKALRALGASVYCQPLLEIGPADELEALREACTGIASGKFQGITFSSSNGVSGLFAAMDAEQLDSRCLKGVRLAAVGPATAEQLRCYGLRADVVPLQDYSARGLLAELRQTVAGQRWLVTQTNRSREVLPEGLRAAGATVDCVQSYRTDSVEQLSPAVLSALEAGRIHMVTITSSAVADAANALLGTWTTRLSAISLSEGVTQRLERLQWPAAIQAREHSDASVVEAIERLWHASDAD